MPEQTKALSRRDEFRLKLEEMKPTLAAILPKHITPERMVRIALQAVVAQPELLECSQNSILRGILQAAQLGLEIGGALGHAYLIPFKGKDGNKHAQFIPGYRGLVDLVRRTGEINSIATHLVYAKDKFTLEYGLDPILKHQPYLDGDPGEVRFGYAIAHFRDNALQFEVMTRHQMDAIRSRSKAANAGPWVTDTEEMYRKTVLRRLIKMLPTSPELRTAVEMDTRVDTEGAEATAGDLYGIEIPSQLQDQEESQSQADKIKSQLKRHPDEPVPVKEVIAEVQAEMAAQDFAPPAGELSLGKPEDEVKKLRNLVYAKLDKRFPPGRTDGKNSSTFKSKWLEANANVKFLDDVHQSDTLKILDTILSEELSQM